MSSNMLFIDLWVFSKSFLLIITNVSSTLRTQIFGLTAGGAINSNLCMMASAINPDTGDPIGVPFICSCI
ncbi:unnamed protein product [Trichobilharzia regenti]|nr:unnamed protein product [Trichobilharzia regenti]